MRRWTAVAAATIASAFAVGIAEYRHALDPGRAETSGVTLNLLVDRGNGKVPNDWFTAGGSVTTVQRGALRLTAGRPGFQLVSRILPVFADECYRLRARAATHGGRAVIAAYDADVTRYRQYVRIPRAPAPRNVSVLVRSPDPRLTLVLGATAGARIVLAAVRLSRLGHRPCGADRPGRDLRVPLGRS